MSQISFKNVSVYYQDIHKIETKAIDDVSFDFKSNSINVLIGYSGCGKTTLLNCLAGKAVFDGDITIDDKDIESIKIQERKMSLVNQEASLYPNLTVYENIAFPLKNAKMKFDEYDKIVKEVALQLDITYLLTRKPKFISIGQASRVCLARALAKQSDIYLFDEPLAHLDNLLKQNIIPLIKDSIKKLNATAIYVTHSIPEALSIADYIYVMNEGKILGIFTPSELLKSDDEIVKSLIQELGKKDEEV